MVRKEGNTSKHMLDRSHLFCNLFVSGRNVGGNNFSSLPFLWAQDKRWSKDLFAPFRVSLSVIIAHWRIINVSKIQVTCNTQDIFAPITLVVGQQTGYGNNAIIYAPCLLKCTRFSHGTKISFCSENLYYGFPKLKKKSVNKSVFLDTQWAHAFMII